MKKRELEQIAGAIQLVINERTDPAGNPVKAKFTYALDRNKDQMNGELKAIGTARQILSDFSKGEKDIIQKYADKNDKGKPIPLNGGMSYKMDPKRVKEAQKAYDDLTEKHKDALDQIKRLLDEDADYKPYMIPFESLPDGLGEIQSVLDPIISEPKEDTG